MSNQTVTISTQFINNSGMPSSVTKVVPAVVVDNVLVADFRQINPGVVTGQAAPNNPSPSVASFA
jgi:hypothetical protein